MKIFRIIIILIFIILFYNLYLVQIVKPTNEISENLLKLNKQIIQNIKQEKSLKSDYTIDELYKKSDLSNLEKLILKISKEFNFGRIIINKKPIAIFYNFTSFYPLKDWSYVYSSNDYTEATKVKYIDEALKDTSELHYHFCEVANKKHWFLCVDKD